MHAVSQASSSQFLRLKVLLISSIVIRKNKIKINNNNIIQDISDHL